MALSLSRKLRITEKATLLTLNAPADFKITLQELPEGTTISKDAKRYDQVHWFVKDRTQMEKELGKVLKLLKDGVIIWVYFPKGSSGIQTDLTRDKGWDRLQAEEHRLTWISLISFDDTWSVFGFRSRNEADGKKQDAKPARREIFDWVDPASKTVTLPPDLLAAFRKAKPAAAFFDTLSFTNKKEYVEWIVTAKKEETRKERVSASVERLGKKWKNPRNL